MKNIQHQHDLNGCGIACVANLFSEEYQNVKKEFEKNFYNINNGIKIFDLVKFLANKGKIYKTVFINHNIKSRKISNEEIQRLIQIPGAIILIRKSEKYPVGHYLLRTNNGFVDSWINYPSINNVHVGIREVLPGVPWYILYPSVK